MHVIRYSIQAWKERTIQAAANFSFKLSNVENMKSHEQNLYSKMFDGKNLNQIKQHHWRKVKYREGWRLSGRKSIEFYR